MRNKRFKRTAITSLVAILSLSTLLSGCALLGGDSEDESDPLTSVFDNTKEKEENGSEDADTKETDKDADKDAKKSDKKKSVSDSEVKEEEVNDQGKPIEEKSLSEFTTEGLIDGDFYVRHSNNQCEPLFICDASFEGSSQQPDSNRVIWFLDERYKEIPTIYQDDSLIFYSTEDFDETFILERFENYGHTIGVKAAYVTKTGRVKLNIAADEGNTFPGSDTDSLLTLVNENVEFEQVGGKLIREEPGADVEDTKCNWLTRSGTFKGFADNTLYEFIVYDGTIRNNMKFTSNVIAMGSMETQETLNYAYEVKDVIHIDIPSNYHDGYYMINGRGIFRYVDDKYDPERELAELDYNIPNAEEDSNAIATINYKKVDSENPSVTDKRFESKFSSVYDGNEGLLTTEEGGEVSSKFTINRAGEVTVEVEFTVPSSASSVDLPPVKGKIVTPNGTKYLMGINADGGLVATFNADKTGDYIIEYDGLEVRVPHVTISVR
ncbi:MAG: hypothetical protein J5525_12710 [Lachnospiraceae bacterium]|nr:hypothetical protein [Lachnospiraceae bacterium]